MHTAGIRQLRATDTPDFTTRLTCKFQISKSLYIAQFRGEWVFLTSQKQLKSGKWEKIFEFKSERIQTNTHHYYSKNKRHELDIPVKIMVFIRQVLYCSLKVRANFQPLCGSMDLRHQVEKRWNCDFRTVAFQQGAHASSGKHGLSQL